MTLSFVAERHGTLVCQYVVAMYCKAIHFCKNATTTAAIEPASLGSLAELHNHCATAANTCNYRLELHSLAERNGDTKLTHACSETVAPPTNQGHPQAYTKNGRFKLA